MTLHKSTSSGQVELTQSEIDEYNARQPTSADLLQKAIDLKLLELAVYHFNSTELRVLMINGQIPLSLTKEGRDLVSEQLNKLDNKVLQGLPSVDAKFNYIHEGSTTEIAIDDLRSLYIAMMDIVDSNWVVYDTHIVDIKNCSTVTDVENYDFTINYLKNQNINI